MKPILSISLMLVIVALQGAAIAKDDANLRDHFKSAPRSVTNALKQGATKEKVVVFIVWNEGVPVTNGINWWLSSMLGSNKTKKLLESQAIITALPLKKFAKHKKFFDGKEEWSQPYILFVDGASQTVISKIKAYANPDEFYQYLTSGLQEWLKYKAKR